MTDQQNSPFDGPVTDAVPDPGDPPAPSAQGDGTSAPPEASDASAAGPDADVTGEDPRVQVLAREVESQKDKYIRLLAEFDNFKRRAVRDRQDAEHRGMGNLLRGILSTLDDLSRFAHVDPSTSDAKTIVEGVQMVEKNLLKSLAGHGLEVVNPVEDNFDPALHEAISTAPAPSAELDDTIAQVFQVGYVFNGQLLRPARVVVNQWNG